jgi:hypothetical protein
MTGKTSQRTRRAVGFATLTFLLIVAFVSIDYVTRKAADHPELSSGNAHHWRAGTFVGERDGDGDATRTAANLARAHQLNLGTYHPRIGTHHRKDGTHGTLLADADADADADGGRARRRSDGHRRSSRDARLDANGARGGAFRAGTKENAEAKIEHHRGGKVRHGSLKSAGR